MKTDTNETIPFVSRKEPQMKKLLAVLLALVLCLSFLAACDQGKGGGNDKDALYTRVDADGKQDADGDYILFGECPQTLMANGVTLTSREQDENGYYLGSDGARYAEVFADPRGEGYTFSTGGAIADGTQYFFKVEPIRWRILAEEKGSLFLLCDSIIANQKYNATPSNNYAESDIRAWLNEEFYNTAFDALQKELILTVTVQNGASTTGYETNDYATDDTNDKVFLLSYEEATTAAYGFSADATAFDPARRKTVSDYARATGAWMVTSDLLEMHHGNGWWLLRSPSNIGAFGARGIDGAGAVGNSTIVSLTENGVVPALQIRFE